jgi:hypothetical protein
MTLRHPFEWLSLTAQNRALWLLLPLTWLVMFGLQRVGRGLVTKEAPHGILSFEFAGNAAQASAIVGSWLLPGARFDAGLSLGLDYLFMPLYASSIALCCVLLSRGLAPALDQIGALLAWAQFVAALLDAIENFALISVLQGTPGDFWPALARNSAIPKFALVVLGLVFTALAVLLRLVQTLRRNAIAR